MRMRHTVNWDLPGCKIFFFHIISQIWGEEIIKQKMSSDFLYKFCLKHFSF